ncbi:MAG: YitT family protein [Hyphomicrobiales bacterium]|nr:YitT family protein [Hyphomicrobiales bacterium]
MSVSPTGGAPHSALEDIQALLTGALFFGFGIVLLKQAHLLTGGTAGAAVLIRYMSGWPTGSVLFAINLPFYLFALQVMGLKFTLRTALAVTLVSVLVDWIPAWIEIGAVQPIFAAILGGSSAGIGILIFIRHKASLGGFNVLSLYIQQSFGWRAGMVQLAFDLVILVFGLEVTGPTLAALSVLGAIALNAVIAVNHRDGRYHAG